MTYLSSCTQIKYWLYISQYNRLLYIFKRLKYTKMFYFSLQKKCGSKLIYYQNLTDSLIIFV